MRIHKQTSIPKDNDVYKDFSCDVLIWDGKAYKMAYYSHVTKQWYEVNEPNPITHKFVWIYPPINKMKEFYNKMTKNECIG